MKAPAPLTQKITQGVASKVMGGNIYHKENQLSDKKDEKKVVAVGKITPTSTVVVATADIKKK